MVFGRVISGIDVIQRIELLPVDANSRPLQDAKIIRCGELIKQVKGKNKNKYHVKVLGSNNLPFIIAKKDKKKKKEESENEDESDEGDERKRKKKHKKEKKKDKKDKKNKK